MRQNEVPYESDSGRSSLNTYADYRDYPIVPQQPLPQVAPVYSPPRVVAPVYNPPSIVAPVYSPPQIVSPRENFSYLDSVAMPQMMNPNALVRAVDPSRIRRMG